MSDLASELNRRTFLHTSLGAGAAMGTVLAADTTAAQQKDATAEVKFQLKEGAVILFQGDSITDAGRDRKIQDPNHPKALGDGYPLLIASELLLNAAKPKIFNRGISGNKVPDLQARWQQDCIALKPDVLSILIGVNDIWHKLNGKYTGTVEDYETGYRELLQETRDKLPRTRIIICDPFVLRVGAVNDKWFPEFDQRRAVAAKLAKEFGLTFVPFQSMFDAAAKTAGADYLAPDGVHPSLAGHSLMAKTWLRTAGL